jgi:hypothetical protein
MDARLRFYPAPTYGFFLTGGIGLGTVSTGQTGLTGLNSATTTEYGVGVILGVGWDLRIRSNLSLTPFWNGIGVSTSNANVGFGQLGIGVTIH